MTPSHHRRLRRQRAEERWLLEGVRALNELGGDGRVVEASSRLNAVQQQPVRHLAACYGSVPADPGDLDGPGAWKAIQGVSAGYGSEDLLAGARTRYQPGKLSLPRLRAGAVDLLAMVPPAEHILLSGGAGLLRARDETSSGRRSPRCS